jgi:hypothetical protein
VTTRAKAGERYDNFLDALGRRLASGHYAWLLERPPEKDFTVHELVAELAVQPPG